jgi:hypothetical protein
VNDALNKPPTPVEKIAAKTDQLRAAAEDMEDAARRAGIEPDMPLAVWVRSLQVVMQHNAELAAWQAENIEDTIAGLLKVARAENERLNAAITASEAQTRKIEAAVGSIDVRAHELLTRTIERMAAEVAEKMRERMVIVQERHNRIVLWRTGVLIACVLLMMLGGGYGWRAYADRGATALLEHCLTAPVQDRNSGQLYCTFQAP